MKFPGWPWVALGVRTLAPIALSACAGVLTGIIWKGGWPLDQAPKQLEAVVWALWITLGLLGLSLFLTPRGIRSFSVKAGPFETSVNDQGERAPKPEAE